MKNKLALFRFANLTSRNFYHTLKLKNIFLIVISATLFVFISACSNNPASSVYNKAEEFLSSGDHQSALENYRYLADKYPDSSFAPRSRYKMGMIYSIYMRDTKKAINNYLALILMYPDSNEVALARGDMAEIYSRAGNHKRAIGEYQWLLENSTETGKDLLRFNIALEYQKEADFNQAIIELRDILKVFPYTSLAPKIYYQVATNQYLAGDLRGAFETYKNIISLYPDNPVKVEAMLGKAIIFEESGKLDEAMGILNSLKDEYPNKDVISIRLASIKKRKKDGPSTRRRRRRK